MLRRLFMGLTEGLLIGLALGVLCARELGLGAPSGVVATLLGALTGFVVGLIAGRPFWARNAKTEALLKAAAGGLVGAGLSLALRHWLAVPVELRSLALGAGPAGQLSAFTLPAIATVLALFFELDNDSASEGRRISARRRVEGERGETEDLAELEALEEHAEHKAEKR